MDPVAEMTRPSLSKMDRFKLFIRNEEKGTYCGSRNAESWRKILTFYFCFYSVLVAFWAICFAVMIDNVPDRRGGSGPVDNEITEFGNVKIACAEYTYSSSDAKWDGASPLSSDGTVADTWKKLARPMGRSDVGRSLAINSLWTILSTINPKLGYKDRRPTCLVYIQNRKFDYPEGSLSAKCTLSATVGSTTSNFDVAVNALDGSVSAPTWTTCCAGSTCGYAHSEDYRVKQNSNTCLNDVAFKNQYDYVMPAAAVVPQVALNAGQEYKLECAVNGVETGSSDSVKLNVQ